jgi:hypothetical protein
MQSENFDNKIRDSLNQRPPGNDNPEWDKMKMLLDKHLPVEKKDRRRFFFILFLFLLLGGGAFFIWKNNGDDEKNISGANPVTEKPSSNEQKGSIDRLRENNNTRSQTNPDSLPIHKTTAVSSSLQADQPASAEKKTVVIINDRLPGNKIRPDLTEKNIKKNGPAENRVPSQAAVIQNPNDQIKNTPAINSGQEKTVTEKPSNATTDVVMNEQEKKQDENASPVANNSTPEKPVENTIEGSIKKQSETKPQELKPVLSSNTKAKKQKPRGSFLNNLFFSLSAGPDLTTVGIDNTGKIKPVLGAGLGYQVSKKFSIKTGFYSARKIYNADPEDYHPPYNFWVYYPNLKNIDADCKVYEIPVGVDYTISQNNTQSWFVSAGLSTYLMKKETYDYYFKPLYSPTYVTYTRTIDNENKHYFSVLNLSGGYTRNINKNISLRAEPYTRIALEGVGYGKVKLNSGGVLFSAIIKPFARK